MKKYLSTIIAVLLALFVLFAPDPVALPLDGIAKFIVALAIFAGVYAVENAIKRRKSN